MPESTSGKHDETTNKDRYPVESDHKKKVKNTWKLSYYIFCERFTRAIGFIMEFLES